MPTVTTPADKAVISFVWKRFAHDSLGKVIFTPDGGGDQTINDAARFYSQGAEFTIPASYITSANLTANAVLQVSQNGGPYVTVKTLTIEEAASSGGGIPQITPEDIDASPVGHTHPAEDIIGIESGTDGLNGVTSIPPFVTSTIATGTGTLRWYNDTGRSLTIHAVRITSSAAPSGSNTLVDVNVNGTTIFSTQSNRPTLTATNVTAVTTTINSPIISSGQYLTVDIDQIGTFAGGTTLSVFITAV